MTFEELRKKRLRWVEANRENNFEDGIRRLLTDLYPDNAHFIYELLQNAEDAHATAVRFTVTGEGVEFEHDGKRLFTLSDVESITGIGLGKKRDDPTNIGKFGIGFKAVFAYTETPEIASGPFHFRIRDLVVPDPEELKYLTLNHYETRFFLPFDNPKKSPKRAREEIEKNLRNLNEGALLFLSNIRKIEYFLADSSLGFLKRESEENNRIGILVQHPEDLDPAAAFFLRFSKTVNVKDEDNELKPCRISVALGLESKLEEDARTTGQTQDQQAAMQWKIKPFEPALVCIYFPAEKETSNLRLHLHAPFASTVARDSIRKSRANDELRDHLASLINESMSSIRDQGLLTVDFLATLPNGKDNLPSFYEPIMKTLVETFNSEKLTPMKQGGHAAASGIFTGQARLSSVITDSDLATILGGKYSQPLWAKNPSPRNQRGRDFLSMLRISQWTTEDLVDELSVSSRKTVKWLSEKPLEWYPKLYGLLGDFLSNAPQYPRSVELGRRKKLSTLCIVRCSDGEMRVGRECYFPSDDVEHNKDFPRVIKEVYSGGNQQERDKARKFLEDIGVREVNEVERVRLILKQRYSIDSIKPHKQDMNRFIDLVENEPNQANLFKDYYIFELENERWGKPRAVYLDEPYRDTDLGAFYKELGQDADRRWALSPKYEKSGIDLKRLGKFAKVVGAQTKLVPKRDSISVSHPEFRKLTSHSGRRTNYEIDVDYDMLEFKTLMDKRELGKSRLIWNTMRQLDKEFLRAIYRPNQSSLQKTGKSTLVHRLQTGKWVPQRIEREIIFVNPCDASVRTLPRGFPYEQESEWLQVIEFGKTRQETREAKRLEKTQTTQEEQRRTESAKKFGFSSAEEAKEVAELKLKDPMGYRRWRASQGGQPDFPTDPLKDPERRKKRVSQQHASATTKEYETRGRNVRTTRGTIDPNTRLKNQYTNDEDQMICQLCKNEMPFRKRDDEHYFESVEAFSVNYFDKEHDAQFIALCPLCAAMYKEFVKRDETAMQQLYDTLKKADGIEVPLTLGEWETSLRFVETHWQDMKTILRK